MIKFILMNLIVGASSYLIAYKFFRLRSLIDSLICWFTVYFSQIIFSEVLLGILGKLYLRNLILLNFAIFLISIAITRRGATSFNLVFLKGLFSEFFSKKVILFLLSLLLGFAVVKLFFNLINPPFGWDCLNYHYTFPVEWIKNANLNNPLVVSDDPFPSYYPINGSLFFLWLIFPLQSAFLADLGQLPFFIISFLAVFSISRKLGLNKEYAFFAAYLFVIIPNFFKQLQIGYVDIMVGGLFLAALNFLLAVKEEFSLKNIILFALTYAIFMGIKTTALPYSIFLLFPFLFLVFCDKKNSLLKKVASLFLFILIVLFFGGFSYLRNFILTGNPFYPLDVTILNNPIFKGVIDKATFIARNEEGGGSLIKLLFHEGMGIQTLLIILPATILGLFINLAKNKKKDISFSYIMALPLLLYLAYRYILPIPNSRYLYPMLGAGIVVGLSVLNSLKISLKAINLFAVIAALASLFESARRLELSISFAAAILLFLSFILISSYQRLRSIIFSKGLILSGIFIFFILLQFLFFDYQKNEYSRYIRNSRYWPDATKAWAWINDNTHGNNIAYVGRPVPYPLYGTNLKNNVFYVSVNTKDPIRLHDLKYSKYRWDSAEKMHKSFEEQNNYRGNADYPVWLENLYRRKTDFLFIYSLHHTKDIIFPIEEKWAKANPDKFKLIFSNNTVMIYRLN